MHLLSFAESMSLDRTKASVAIHGERDANISEQNRWGHGGHAGCAVQTEPEVQAA